MYKMATQSACGDFEIEYTVKKTAKIHQEKQIDPRPSVWLSVAKWLVAIFLFAAVLFCVTASKISLLSVAKTSKHNNRETAFIMIVVILMVPQGFAFLRTCWGSLFRSSHPWPSNKALCWGIVAAVMEVIGLSFFTVVVLSNEEIRADVCLLMMTGIFVAPVVWQIWQTQNVRNQIIFVVAAVIELIAIGVLTYKLVDGLHSKKIAIVVMFPVSILLVSFAWCPKVSKLQLEPRGGYRDIDDDFSVAVEGSNPDDQVNPNQGNTERHHKTARGKSTIITSFLKLVLTPFIAAAFCKWYDVAVIKSSSLQEGFSKFNTHHPSFPYFMTQIFTSLLGYLLGSFACGMRLQRCSFAFPLTLATPLAMVVVLVPGLCGQDKDLTAFKCGKATDPFILPLAFLLCLAQFLSTGYYVWKKEGFIMAKESAMFWLPTYNGVLLEQNLLLNRKNEITDENDVNQRGKAENSHVFICTTMYHEAEHEMEQLLNSIHDIDCARQESQRGIESHIWFDGAVKGETCNNYVLQLIGLVKKALKVNMETCTKMKTPYGMELRWRLPGGMHFHIHLKDNLKVKNKKRWSQVMYMSYVLDYKKKQLELQDDSMYILTTDADVQFTHTSVEALLDLMLRDPQVGAVCGRTHPLGSGPMVWYQIFDYAIGHWFQKVANHVLGSVLCCPGCFSVYRVSAIRDILPIYSSGVDNSFDFLTKDMGEDRWFCTLLVQSGWKLEYCAAAEDHTFCPDNFNEFFKQRRRWIPSTMANIAVLISEWRVVIENNDLISFLFILYQALMVISTIICPATVILIMVGGLQMAYADTGLDLTAIVLVLCTITVLYGIICLYASQDFQLKVAKLLTIVFALLMAGVVVGIAASIVKDLSKRSSSTEKNHNTSLFFDGLRNKYFSGNDVYMGPIQDLPSLLRTMPSDLQKDLTTPTALSKLDRKLPAAVSTLYLAGVVGIFIFAALLHPFEAYCVLHGVWYLLCLPTGYLLLIVYSVCNMTDRSWGTREEKTKKSNEEAWYETLLKKLRYIFTCCREQPPPPQPPGRVQQPVQDKGSPDELSEVSNSPITSEDDDVQTQQNKDVMNPTTSEEAVHKELPKSVLKPSKLRKAPSIEEDTRKTGGFRYPGQRKVTFAAKLPKLHSETPVEEWLKDDMEDLYLDNFKRNGYDNISFISGMTDKDLRDIGITTRGHRKRLLYAIEKIPNIEIEQNVPDNVEEWLHDIGLEVYWSSFKDAGYTDARMLEDLKGMTKETLEQTLHVHKIAHINKLYNAIKKLRYPTPGQRRIRAARNSLKDVPFHDLKTDNYDDGKEYEFWEGLRKACLLPESQIFGGIAELKEELTELRDKTVMVFFITNAIWLIAIITLLKQSDLNLLGTNVLGLAFLCIYGVLIALQFLTLLWHRLITMRHVLARASWTRKPVQMSYAFSNTNLLPEPDPALLDEIRSRWRRRRTRGAKKRPTRRSRSPQTALLADNDFASSGSYNTFNDYVDRSEASTPLNMPV